MSRIPRLQSIGDFYHIYSRGSGRQLIFEDNADHQVFLDCLSDALRETDATLYAYALMGNHYHLVVQVDYEHLPKFGHSLNCDYAKYFNARHEHIGHLFQDRFSSQPINDDEYFLSAIRYVHRNPLEAKLSATCSYPWSSYDAYITGSGNQVACPIPTKAIDMLGDLDAFREFHTHSGKESFDDDVPTSTRIDSDEILALATAALDGDSPTTLKSLPKPARNHKLCTLKSAGLSIRQIALITGISRSIVQRA